MRTPAPTVLAEGSLSEAALLQVQQTAGNAAATALVQRQPNGPGTVPATEAGTPAAGTSTVEAQTRRTLRYGHTGPDVKQLQMKLRSLRERRHDLDRAGRNSKIDGIFGPLTRKDVIDFQGDTGLEADGIVGPRTWDAIDSLVPNTPDEGQERAFDERNDAALELFGAGQYDAALVIFEAELTTLQSPEMVGMTAWNAGSCHQQRGRFGLAVVRLEQALAGRFNQEPVRRKVLDGLMKARRGEFLDAPPPDPEPLPPGADPATAAGREGGGVTEREPVKSGDSGPAVDLFKGKLAHVMLGWPPTLPAGDTFDAPTVERTRAFQQACALTSSGEADASTWHALDSFTKADVPFSVAEPHLERGREALRIGETDPAASLPLLEANRDEARALGLTESVKLSEAQIGRSHHQLSHFPEAVEHYTLFLDRNIPFPRQYGYVLEHLRKARRGEPPAD
ncbi:MAG: peptidoglycan-binding protein [Chloroflexi bacterium]|nr:peptidoglycan-binding protein [Chloroflexota bacterium]